ncbi:MAG: glycosyltransferase family 2 protein [Chloroflexi bacterium]|nr:glycosyltransferase family 2 protein [Chloroflexota bacterium]
MPKSEAAINTVKATSPEHSAPPYLSIIVPAYNEERRLAITLPLMANFVEAQPYAGEIIVVDDGSQDRTANLVEEFSHTHPYVKVVRAPHKGKGNAVRIGMLSARGDYRFLCDADLAMPVEEIAKFLPPRGKPWEVAIGSREGPGARRFNEPGYRHVMGRVFNALVKLLAVPEFEDTQCGFKCFRAAVVPDLYGHQTMEGWGFDVEVLYIARKRGYRIIEVPIHWYYQSESKVHPIRDTVRMVQDLLRVRMNDRHGIYDVPQGSVDSRDQNPRDQDPDHIAG